MKAAFYKGKDKPFNKLVSWKMDGPYSHCEAVIGYNPISERYLCASASFSDGGVRFKEIALNPSKWDVIEVPCIDKASVIQWFKDHEGEPYDVRGLVNFVIPVGHNPVGWFCDEALAAAAGIPQPHRFDPNGVACIFERLGGVWVQGESPWHQAV